MSGDLGLAHVGGRCAYGYASIQHPSLCECSESEWSIFVTALRSSARTDGTVHQSDVRPLIRGRINPKHIGTLWRRAKADGLIRDTGQVERSNDHAGRNSHRLEPIYELRSAA